MLFASSQLCFFGGTRLAVLGGYALIVSAQFRQLRGNMSEIGLSDRRFAAGLSRCSLAALPQRRHHIYRGFARLRKNTFRMAVYGYIHGRSRMSGRVLPWLLLLGLNGAAWFFFARQPVPARSAGEVRHFASTNPPRTKPAVTNNAVRTNDFSWQQLESEDYRTYIERLRKIGCPEETIHDIIIADLEKLMAGRVREIDGPAEPPKFWKPNRKDLTSTLEALEKQGKKQEVDFEKREIVRELLGIDLAAARARAKGEQDFYEQRLSFLDAEKLGKVRMLIERANREELYVREKSWLENDELTAGERAELRTIQQRKEQEIAELLSPEEKEQFDLWFSPAAYRVRDAFLALEPNEEDFLALYGLQREFDREWGAVEPSELNPEEKARMEEARLALEHGMREHLGEERYERMQQARDADFRRLQDAVIQFGLRREVTAEIYDYRGALAEERERVRRSGALSASQRESVLRALSEETEQAVVEAMGPKAYRYYVRNGAGRWIWEN